MTFGWLRGPLQMLHGAGSRIAACMVARWRSRRGRRPRPRIAEIAHRRAAERKNFTDAEIIDGFFKVTFGAEFHVAGGVDRIRKYDGPVRVYRRQPRQARPHARRSPPSSPTSARASATSISP